MDYMTAKEAAEKWEITPRRVKKIRFKNCKYGFA